MNTEDIRKDTFKEVYGVESIKEVSEQFKKEYRKIKNEKDGFDKISNLFQKYVLSITLLYSVTSMKNNLKLYRNIINKEGGIWKDTVKSSFYIFDVYKAVLENTEKKLEAKEEAQKEIAFEVKDEIEKVKILLDRRAYIVANNQNEKQVRSYYLSYILGLSTGRRFTEIFKTTSFRKKGNKFIYSGILKKYSDSKEEIEANFLYLSSKEVKGYMKELREYLDTKLTSTKNKSLEETTEEEINTIFSKVYNNSIKRITKGVVPNFHELRHYYAIEGTIVFKINDETDEQTRYRILGHRTKKDSTRTYKTIK